MAVLRQHPCNLPDSFMVRKASLPSIPREIFSFVHRTRPRVYFPYPGVHENGASQVNFRKTDQSYFIFPGTRPPSNDGR